MNEPIPLTEGTEICDKLASEYIRHKSGLFILAPSGTGKTHFVNRQQDKHWIDGDYLWVVTGADPTGDDWDTDMDLVHEVNRRCDTVTAQAKELGFWVMGSSNDSLPPDAIVLPPWEEHVRMIDGREKGGAYDGGAKVEDLDGVQAHREWIAGWEAKGVPRFDSIDVAVAHLTAGTEYDNK